MAENLPNIMKNPTSEFSQSQVDKYREPHVGML